MGRQGSDGTGQGTDEHLEYLVGTEGQPPAANLNEAGGAAPEHAQAAASANPQFRQAMDPVGLAADVADLGPLAGTEVLQGQ